MTEDKPTDQQPNNQSDPSQQTRFEKAKDDSRFAPPSRFVKGTSSSDDSDANRFTSGGATEDDEGTSRTVSEKTGHFLSGMDSLVSKTQAIPVNRGSFADTAVLVPGEGGATESRIHRPSTTYAAPQENIYEEVYVDPHYEKIRLIVLAILICPVLIFSFFPAVQDMVKVWYRVQDYSHGFLIVPLVVYFLWIRFDTYPGTEKSLCWWGLIPLVFSCVARYYGSLQYRDAVEQWSIFFWVLGVIWMLYGNRVFLWALPSLSFMLFMFPLPYTFEMKMRQQLQQIAADFAVFLLQVIGQPAVNIRTTIYLDVHEIGIEAACSGIRFMISFFAIGIGTILLLRRPWWNNLVILIGIVPIALFINALRIVITSLFIRYGGSFLKPFTNERTSLGVVADKFAGYIAIGLAFAVFALFVYYVTRVIRKVKVLEPV